MVPPSTGYHVMTDEHQAHHTEPNVKEGLFERFEKHRQVIVSYLPEGHESIIDLGTFKTGLLDCSQITRNHVGLPLSQIQWILSPARDAFRIGAAGSIGRAVVVHLVEHCGCTFRLRKSVQIAILLHPAPNHHFWDSSLIAVIIS